MLNYDIQLEHELAASPDLVWRVLSERELLSRWMMENDFAAIVGHRFTFRAKPMPFWDGIVRGEVKEVRPAERLVYSWIGASDMPETTVSWLIRPAQSGTHLTFNHTGFSGLKYGVIGRLLKRGWQDMIGRRLPSTLRAISDPSRIVPASTQL
jgi:uncharacterized protein YndB with AHSA1/START domain